MVEGGDSQSIGPATPASEPPGVSDSEDSWAQAQTSGVKLSGGQLGSLLLPGVPGNGEAPG